MKNWEEYSKEHFLFILSQAEKELDETVETMKTIHSKSRFQLGVSLSSFTALTGWFISNHNNSLNNYFWLLILLLGVSIFFDLKAISNYGIYTKGSSPDFLLDSRLYDFANASSAEKNLIYNEIQDYRERIDYNRTVNLKRVSQNSKAFIILCSCPVFLLLAYFGFSLVQ